jgi:hypothetical protein
MKIAVMTSLLAKGNMDVDTAHGVLFLVFSGGLQKMTEN